MIYVLLCSYFSLLMFVNVFLLFCFVMEVCPRLIIIYYSLSSKVLLSNGEGYTV